MSMLAAITAVIHEGKVLLTQREDFEVWCLPGGAVEEGESVAEAAVRETLEETGLVVELTGLVGVYSRIGGLPDVHVVLFTARPISGHLCLQPGETIDARFFPSDDIPTKLLFGHRQRIDDALSGVGGSTAWCQSLETDSDLLTRQQLYDERDRSGLSRSQFYQQFLDRCGPQREDLQVPR